MRLAENAMLLPSFEDARVGVTETGAAVYSIGHMLDSLCKDMSEADAREYLAFNVYGLHAGDDVQPPVFVLLEVA